MSATQALGWFARSASHTRAVAFDFPKPKCFGLRGTLRPRHALSHDRGVDVERHGSESYGATLGTLTTTQRNALVANTPVRFYILREAELNPGGKLRAVGGRILAETFHRAIQGSKFSNVRDAAFRPTLGPNNSTFRMIDLLLVADGGQAAQLNPNGN